MRGETKKGQSRSSHGAAGDRMLSWKPWGGSVSRCVSRSVWDADEMSSRIRIGNGPFDLTTWRFICDLGKNYFDEVKETEA